VAHCIETVHAGGVEQTRLTLAQGLDPARYDQMVICTQAMGALPAQFEAAGCRVEVVGTFQSRIDRSVIAAAKRKLEAFRPHIVHGAVFEGVVTAVIAGRLARVPVVIGEETADPDGRRWTGHNFLKLLALFTDGMIGVSPFVRDYLVQKLHIPARKVVLVNNGVVEPPPADPEQVARIRREHQLDAHHFVLGTVSRLFDQQKRVSDALRAMQQLRARLPEARLLIVGEGTDREALRRLAVELGVEDLVRFAGYQSDTRPFFEAMDLFVHPAASEAFGLVLVEAMFARRPILATRVGGIPDVVAEGETALLVEPYQPDKLADAIVELTNDPERRTRMGEAGLRRARAMFGQDRYVREIDALYTSLLKKKPAGR
jgi:L-malate glycosyltransferase